MAPNGNLDVLGILSDMVLDEILVRLPLREAVKTSVLSKSWRYKWCRLPELKLDNEIRMEEDNTYYTSYPTSLIYHILTHHAGPISKFVLEPPYLDGCPTIQSADMDNLIYFLSRHNIAHLVLDIRVAGQMYCLPRSFYTFLNLTHLCLRECSQSLLPPLTFKGFQRLNSLELYNIQISSKVLSSLVSNPPLLENLVLIGVQGDSDVIEINAPMLRTFKFRGWLRNLRFQSVPPLSELSLTDYSWDGVSKTSIMDWETCAKLVRLLSGLEFLSMGSCFHAGQSLVPTRLSCYLNRVKHFNLCVDLSRLDSVLCTLCLIRSFPCLQCLTIQVAGEERRDLPFLECLEVERFPDGTFDHLKEVFVRNILGTDCDFQLIKLLLAKSPLLERMQIQFGISIPMEVFAYIQIQAKVTEFPRASARADVIFS